MTSAQPIELEQGVNQPPTYLDFKAGTRDEFYQDIEAYQAAAAIHANQKRANSSDHVADQDDEVPDYARLGDTLPTAAENRSFQKRILYTLREMRNFIEERRNKRSIINFLRLSEKVQLIAHGTLFVIMLVILAVCAGMFTSIGSEFPLAAIMVPIGIMALLFGASTFLQFYKYKMKLNLIESLQKGLGQVERFEKIDEKTLATIKKTVRDVLSPMFWIRIERKLEEGGFEFDTNRAQATAPPPPPPPAAA